MRKAIMIAGLVLALGVLAPATALGKAGGTERPVQGNGSGTTVLDLATLTFVTDSTSVVSHVGRSTIHIDGVVTPTGPSTFTLAGSLTLTAANGDQQFGDFSGSGTNDGSGRLHRHDGHHDHRRHRALYGRQRKCQRPVHPDAGLDECHDGDLRHHVLAERHDQLLAKTESETSKGTLVDEGPLHLVGGRCR